MGAVGEVLCGTGRVSVAAYTSRRSSTARRTRSFSWMSASTSGRRSQGIVVEAIFRSRSDTAVPVNSSFGLVVRKPDTLKIASTTIPWERLPEVLADIQEKLRVLRAVEDRLDVYAATETRPVPHSTSPTAPIFLVHGHDIARRELVRRFLETVTDRDVVVLADQPNRGQDILGKLLVHAQQAVFAVVLLTPDDEGGESGKEKRASRARQNVVFELGMFIGLLGRDRVAALNDPAVELPTDFSGVAYIPIDGDSWQIELARELKAAGISVSLDRAI